MDGIRSRRRLYWAVTAVLALAIGVGSFWGVRALVGGGSEATAERDPGWWTTYFNQDAQKPRFNQEINGILVGPGDGLEPTSDVCTGLTPQWTDPEKAKGTVVDFSPSYLPEGVKRAASEPESVMECGGTVFSVLRSYDVPAKYGPDVSPSNPPEWSGGNFSIWRMLSDKHTFPLLGAAERMEPITVAGRAAVLMRPVMPEGEDYGLGKMAIVIAEDFGLTAIQGGGLPLGEFIKIAEGLYEERAQ
jgi:hypothetical protein